MEYRDDQEIKTLDHGQQVIAAMVRAVVAHPAYQIGPCGDYLTDPTKFFNLRRLPATDTNKLRSNREHSIINDLVPFRFSRWVGDLPNINAELQKENTPCVIAVNAVFSEEFKNKWGGKVYELSAPWMSIFYRRDQLLSKFENCAIEKDFACPINRLDPTRQSWFYLLIRRGLLPCGFVSFTLDHSRSTADVKDLDQMSAFETLYQKYMLNFSEEHEIAKQIVPYRNFSADENLDSVLMKSRFNIILETYFSFNDQIMFTEKTMRSLRLPRPWLLHGAKGSVEHLRRQGFDVLDDLVDHNSYDHIDHPIERQSRILDLAQDLCNFDTVANWDRLTLAATVNNEILLRWKNALPQIAFDDFYRIIDDYAIRNNLLDK